MSKITIDRSVVEQALEDICGAKLCEINSMSSRHEMLRLMEKSASALRAALEQSKIELEPGLVARLPLDGRGGYTSPEPQVEQEPFTVLVRKRSWLDNQWEAAPRGFPDYGKLWADERINVYTHPQNLNCKSTQHRLATLWGYEKPQPFRQPLTDEEITALADAHLKVFAQFAGAGAVWVEGEEEFTRAIERAHRIGGEV